MSDDKDGSAPNANARPYSFVESGPPPDMEQRKLIFDSLSKIVGQAKRGGRGTKGQSRGTYVFAWGAGYHGQLGLKFVRGMKKYSAVPVKVPLEEVSAPTRQITCGGLHTASVTESGDVFTWGDGRKGQLGHRTRDLSMQQTPVCVMELSSQHVIQVACGDNHTVCITGTGQGYSWGFARNGQLGHGDRSQHTYPMKINDELARNLVQISAGNKHTMAVNKDGVAIAWGCGDHGQTGLGSPEDKLSPQKVESIPDGLKISSVDCGSIHTCLVSEDGRLFLCGFGEYFHPNESKHFFYTPHEIKFPEPVKQIACGQSHNVALTERGNVFTWGHGGYGQLGHGIYNFLSSPRIVLEGKGIAQVAAGRYHSFALSNAGILYSWGCGENGQLGLDSDKDEKVPTVVHSILGTVVGQVACGEHHSAILTSAPWTTLSVDVAEWLQFARQEKQLKLDHVEQNNKGISRKDLQKIAAKMREIRAEYNTKKQADRIKLDEELQKDVESIRLDQEQLTIEVKQELDTKNSSRDMKLPQVNEAGVEEGEEESKEGGGTVKLPRVGKKNKPRRVQSARGLPAVGGRGEQGGLATTQLIDGSQGEQVNASITRAVFLKETAQMINRMKSVVMEKGDTATQTELQRMMRLVFTLRKECDQLRHTARERAHQLELLKRETRILHQQTSSSKEDQESQEEKLKSLEMQLNTVTIKIAETEENRRNYDMSITHLKEEDFDHFQQLKSLRKQNYDNNSFFKKMNELKAQAVEDKEKAEMELEEFRTEIENYQAFVNTQLQQFEQILEIVRAQNEKRERAKDLRSEKQQEKIAARVAKLELEAEAAEKEASGLTSRLNSLDLKMRHFEDSFQKITAATGLTNPEAIVAKFEFKGEIREQLQQEIDDKQNSIDKLSNERAELQNDLKGLKAAFKEQKWRDVEKLTEEGREVKVREDKAMSIDTELKEKLTIAQEGMLSLLESVSKTEGKPSNILSQSDDTELWSPESTDEVFQELHECIDRLLETEQLYNAKLKEEEEKKQLQNAAKAENDKALSTAAAMFGLPDAEKGDEAAS